MICRSKRTGDKVSQEVVRYLGVAHSEEQKRSLLRLAQEELKSTGKGEASKEKLRAISASLENMVEIGRFIEGMHDIFGSMLDKTHIAGLMKPYEYERLKDIVVARIGDPNSKLHTAEVLSKEYLKPISEDKIYRLMDALHSKQTEIKRRIFETTKSFIENEKIDVLFFDVTTLHLESQHTDDLRNFGMSKAHKVGEVQVVLALATTSEGLPIGYNLFPGNTAEVSTLLVSIKEWTQDFDIRNVTVVADRAMMAEGNLSSMEEEGLGYTVAAKLRSLPASKKKEILSRQGELEGVVCRQKMSIQEHEHKGRRLIVSYSESRAKKDRGDRARLLARIEKKYGGRVEGKELVTNKGYLKYFKEEVKGKLVLDESKILEDAEWDGLHGVITNDKQTSAIGLLERYRGLWVIEESFRINKHTLKMRPMYHFKAERIESHILICYIAYALSRFVEKHVSEFHRSMSLARIREELEKVQYGILEDTATGERYKMPSASSSDTKEIYRSMGMKRRSKPEKISLKSKNVVENKKIK